MKKTPRKSKTNHNNIESKRKGKDHYDNRLWIKLAMPQSLRGKFTLALTMMSLMIVIGSITAIYSLHITAETSQHLAEERLERLQDAQSMLYNTLLINHQSRLLVTTKVPKDIQENYSQMIMLLDSLDQLVARFGQTNNSPAILDLHQASQLFRNTIHIIARLRTNTKQTKKITMTRMSELQIMLNRFQQELESQSIDIATAAKEISKLITEEYRHSVVQLSASTHHRQQFVFAVLIGCLLLIWGISRHFRNHAVNRLQQVSNHLRLGSADEHKVSVPVHGDDEIGQMARAVERFLEDHHHLVVTKRKLSQNEEMLSTITNAVQSAVVLIDDKDVIRFANPAAEKLFGYSQKELDGCKLHDTLVPKSHQARAKEGFAEFLRTGTGPVLEKPQELLALRKDGTEIIIELYVGRIRRGNHWWAVGAAIDITKHKSREEMLTSQAETDSLTGVRNRRSFMQLAANLLEHSRQDDMPLFFLMFDLDYFKKINDTYGHPVGDEVLCKFATLCVHNLRDTDIFARIGGEEFAAVIPGKDIRTVIGVAERIRMAFANTTVTAAEKQLKIDISVSIGLVQVNPEQDNVENCLEKADIALYQAKIQGRNRIVTN